MMSWKDGSLGRWLASSRSEKPMMAVSTLLKSCAMPPASWPTDSIFCCWRTWCSSARCSVMSMTLTITISLPPAPSATGLMKKRPERWPSPASVASIAGMTPTPSAAEASAAARLALVLIGDQVGRACARRPAATPGNMRRKGALVRPMRPLRSIAAMAIGVLLKKRAKRTSAARSASDTSSPGERLSTTVRVAPGAPSTVDRHAVQQAHRQALAVGARRGRGR